jgi:uncharacterized membrane protein
VSKPKVDVNRRTEPAGPVSASAGDRAKPSRDFVTAAATLGAIAAGVALLEVALIPGLVVGGAAALAPKYLPKYLPKLRRRLRPLINSTVRPRIESVFALPGRPDVRAPLAAPARLAIKQALAKTITFQIIVTTLDFTVNYVVLGELVTAAGLSAFGLVARPVFYLVHETAWNYFGASDKRVDLSALLAPQPDAKTPLTKQGGFTISRALAKTITFRTAATVMDFTANYVVVGNFATAVALSASGFVLGPFVYFGHEWAWDHYGPPTVRTTDPLAPANLAPAPS